MARVFPGVVALDCRKCEKHFYDIPAGTLQTQGKAARSIPRGSPGKPGFSPPPCFKCPKKRPDFKEAQKRLYCSLKNISIEENKNALEVLSEKNRTTLQFHAERKIFGYSELESADQTVRENAVIIQIINEQVDREENQNATAEIIAALF